MNRCRFQSAIRGNTPLARQVLLRVATILAMLVFSAPIPAGAIDATPDLNQDPNSVVPAPFNRDMNWSEEGGWHWVRLAYYGNNTTVGRNVSPVSYVATLVKSLQANVPCTNCVSIDDQNEGPPIIPDGATNPSLAPAYDNLDNGSRHRNTDGTWPSGDWYLNYDPGKQSFFSFTWIPATSTSALGLNLNLAAHSGSQRVFPLSGDYTVTQSFGCVPADGGYPSPPTCPPDRPSFHDGIDLGAPAGTPIVAAASGTVSFVGMSSNQPGANSRLVIQHDGFNRGYQTVYLHWKQSLVSVGEHVIAGQEIALVGSVGYSTGPHLHFTVLDADGNALDPTSWLRDATVPTVGSGSAPVTTRVLKWQPLMQAAADRYDVPVAFIAAIMTVESGGDPGAVSAAGAQGLLQVMPAELTALGVAPDQWLDPAANIEAGTRYMAQRLSAGMSLDAVAAAYFGQGCDVYGTCTAQYVATVMNWYDYYTAIFAGQPATPPNQIAPPAQTTSNAEVLPSTSAQAQSAPESALATPSPAASPSTTPTAAPSTTPKPTSNASPTPDPSPTPAIDSTPSSTPAEQPTAEAASS